MKIKLDEMTKAIANLNEYLLANKDLEGSKLFREALASINEVLDNLKMT